MRLKDIAAPEQFRKGTRGLKLFTGGGTHPDDIDGSSSGLMVAVACLANKPGAIEEVGVGSGEGAGWRLRYATALALLEYVLVPVGLWACAFWRQMPCIAGIWLTQVVNTPPSPPSRHPHALPCSPAPLDVLGGQGVPARRLLPGPALRPQERRSHHLAHR